MKLPLPLATAGAKLLTTIDPEQAHRLTIRALRTGFQPAVKPVTDKRLAIRVAGLNFPNPLGLAAGFDKNAEVADEVLALGFGFVEVGAVTPKPQPGNDRPRVFRLKDQNAVINRYGFNNDGLALITQRLQDRDRSGGIVGINLGANKTTEDKAADYVTGLQALEPHVDFATVNISSPNTPGLRTLQGRAPLEDLLARVLSARTGTLPVFLKIAPDLTDEDKADIAAVAKTSGIDGLIVSNTTITRPDGLDPDLAKEAGGLSGEPLFELSTAVLKDFAVALGGAVPLIGVGGVSSAKDAYAKILAGASLVQLYTAMVYEGPGLPTQILRGLVDYLQADGFTSVEDAVGKGI
ncbi:quinone-dependent dihydroorotate dehydrogenase [Parvularcula flava]|uniref:Dihydroorotate dehydrogenase (quinone) n=1 Tax=Aquisalinus luteolus TaxID=1566827 RepID=A0A8J3ERV1_9PROT|nr:quinone-dependent dihydroorotate dehydrogenase [Aquisalinus luteolus]NHK28565.1 quinone-dependent dihydroorotate dehydrogenase [Aquisalinus luteolus]GGH98856.1 dihydroorotate dehydrogenase (quinone) [Aquisalinus luteolus]